MNESRWEASRRSARKNVVITFLVFVGISAIIAILIINNRDQIEYAPVQNPVAAEKKISDTIPPFLESTGNVPVQEQVVDTIKSTPSSPEIESDPAPAALLPSPPKPVPAMPVQVEATVPATPVKTATLPNNSSAKVSGTPEKIPVRSGRILESIKLPSIRCSVDSRKDVVISISLELFFEDTERRSAILLRRDAIKVMTLKTLRGKELGEITTGKLEAELHKAINRIFDHGDIVAVKISDIRIEKAVKE